MSDIRRMEEVYTRREALHPQDYYSMLHPGHLYLMQRREEVFLRTLARIGVRSLQGLRILDLGCGTGETLWRFVAYGAEPEHVVGVEIHPEFAAQARRRLGSIAVVRADAADLPFPTASFDLVHQATMMTLVREAATRRRIAAEMLRMVRPGGAILWFDMRYSNPRNPDMQGIGRAELHRLFPACTLTVRTVSLLPAIARRLAPLSFVACRALEVIRPLRIHYLAVIRPPR